MMTKNVRNWIFVGLLATGLGLEATVSFGKDVSSLAADLQGLVVFQRGGVIRADDFNTNFGILAHAVQGERDRVGDLDQLATTNKGSVVQAINELSAAGPAQGAKGDPGPAGPAGPAGPGWTLIREGTFDGSLSIDAIPSRYKEFRIVIDGAAGYSTLLTVNGVSSGYFGIAGGEFESTKFSGGFTFGYGNFDAGALCQLRLLETSIGVVGEGNAAGSYMGVPVSGILRGETDVTSLKLQGWKSGSTASYVLFGRE